MPRGELFPRGLPGGGLRVRRPAGVRAALEVLEERGELLGGELPPRLSIVFCRSFCAPFAPAFAHSALWRWATVMRRSAYSRPSGAGATGMAAMTPPAR